MSIGVIVEFQFKPGEGAAAISPLKERMPTTRSTEGCEYIHVYRDSNNADRYFLVERWTSRAQYDKYREWALAQPSTSETLSHLKRA